MLAKRGQHFSSKLSRVFNTRRFWRRNAWVPCVPPDTHAAPPWYCFYIREPCWRSRAIVAKIRWEQRREWAKEKWDKGLCYTLVCSVELACGWSAPMALISNKIQNTTTCMVQKMSNNMFSPSANKTCFEMSRPMEGKMFSKVLGQTWNFSGCASIII